MPIVITPEYLQAVAAGDIAGASLVHKFGYNNAVPNGSWAHVSALPFDIANFRTTPSTVRVKSGGNAADTSDGLGAREVTVQGIDSNLLETTETIVTAGADASSPTTKTWWRIHRAWVSSCGEYGGDNVGDVVIEDSSADASMIKITAAEGQSQYAGFTIPIDKKALLLTAHVTISTNKTTDVRCFTRNNFNAVAPPFSARRLKLYWKGLQTPGFPYRPYCPELTLAPLTDIWFMGYGDGAISEISANFELLLLDI